ncbi:MAG: hypothetical protein DRN61_04670 [Thaumarchaeota archaeon]|nr:MAG: hypothetical protein DRN61_04670 [Nitrososphaerota archaeon]
MAGGLKDELLRLLREDVDVRAAVASIITSHYVVEELKALREDMKHGFDTFSAELKALREDFNRHEEAIKNLGEDLKALREDFNRHEEESAKRLKAFEEEMRKLREDFNKLSHWMMGVAGYRWGLASEEAFRQAVDYIAKSLGYPIAERKVLVDHDGSITGTPGREIDVNACIKDKEHLLIEVTMYAKKEDLWKLNYASKLYQRETGHKPKLLLITPHAPPEVQALAQKLDIHVLTD